MPARFSGLIAAWGVVCLAAIGAACAGGVESAADAVPPDVDFFLAVDDASLWRRGPAGEFFTTIQPLVFHGADLADAWAGLAKTLALDEAGAFDALLGTRVVFVHRTGGGPDRRSWAMLSHVSRETEQQVRSRIRPAARRVEKGQTLLAIEDGRFWIASAKDGTGAVLLLGPSDSPTLLNDLLPTLGRSRKHSLASSKVGDDLKALRPGAQAMMMSRWRTAEGRLVLFAASAHRQPEGLSLSVLLRSESLAERLKAVGLTSRSQADRLASGAWFTMVDWHLPGVVAELGGPHAESSAPPMFKAFPGRMLLGPRRAVAIGPTAAGRVSAVLALETTDVDALAAPADQLMASALMGLWAGATMTTREVFDFQGRFADALRHTPIPEPMLAFAPALLDDSSGLGWMYQRSEPHADGPKPGWWVVGLGVDEVRRVAATLGTPPAKEDKRAPWVNVGVASPAELAGILDKTGFPLPGSLGVFADAMRRVRSAEWAFYRGDSGSLRGAISFTFVHEPR